MVFWDLNFLYSPISIEGLHKKFAPKAPFSLNAPLLTVTSMGLQMVSEKQNKNSVRGKFGALSAQTNVSVSSVNRSCIIGLSGI